MRRRTTKAQKSTAPGDRRYVARRQFASQGKVGKGGHLGCATEKSVGARYVEFETGT
ncbi:hypothetical protein MYX65_00695 [Acidobacteria bacterium AH-259-L09]|nr:hypothetical protein [Acidobacteria bacterium AH-259-L09]